MLYASIQPAHKGGGCQRLEQPHVGRFALFCTGEFASLNFSLSNEFAKRMPAEKSFVPEELGAAEAVARRREEQDDAARHLPY